MDVFLLDSICLEAFAVVFVQSIETDCRGKAIGYILKSVNLIVVHQQVMDG
jgi:hypothetical protein